MEQHINKVKSQFIPAFGNKAHVQWGQRYIFLQNFKKKAKLRREKVKG